MNYYLILMLTGLVVNCTPVIHPEIHTNTEFHLTGGVEEPVYPPDGPINCWIQPPRDKYWYPCPQKSDEELGKHGH